MRRKLIEVSLSLFFFNSFSLFLYLTFHHRQAPESDAFPFQQQNVSVFKPSPGTSHVFQKPWPILPSYLPWTPPASSPPPTCESYFGNGFIQRRDLLPSDGRGWLRCHFNPTLRTSVCEGGNVKMDTLKVHVSRGGEEIESVMGRNEDEEIPRFDDGAFEVVGDKNVKKMLADVDFLDSFLPRGDLQKHPMRDLVGSFRTTTQQHFHCDKWIDEPALMVIRFEYANVFHTVTDWYSAYVACRVANLPYRPHLVFVDGHCRTQLEETWRAMFSSVRYAKHFNGSVCFRHVVFAPIGYETAMFRGLREEINCEGSPAQELWRNPNEHKTARVSEFGEMIRGAFELRQVIEKQQIFKVLFVRREDYLAHPRHLGKVESRLSNEEEVYLAVQAWGAKQRECKIRVINGLLAHMPLRDQARAIQEAAVIIGAHGAGLTHIVGASPGAVILEVISSYFRRPHFRMIAKWKGLRYHVINLHGSYASPEAVTAELASIMKTLGC